jgi:hypothetical protein
MKSTTKLAIGAGVALAALGAVVFATSASAATSPSPSPPLPVPGSGVKQGTVYKLIFANQTIRDVPAMLVALLGLGWVQASIVTDGAGNWSVVALRVGPDAPTNGGLPAGSIVTLIAPVQSTSNFAPGFVPGFIPNAQPDPNETYDLWLGSDMFFTSWTHFVRSKLSEDICIDLSDPAGAEMRAGTSGQILTDSTGNVVAASFAPGTLVRFCPGWTGS